MTFSPVKYGLFLGTEKLMNLFIFGQTKQHIDTMNDKEKLEAIEKIINKKAEEMDDLPWSKREETNKLLGGIKQSDYKKILKETADFFFNEMEMYEYELNKRCKKEITEYFDKLFKDPEFERMITKAMNEAPDEYGD